MPLWDDKEQARIKALEFERTMEARDNLATGKCPTCKLFAERKRKTMGDGNVITTGKKGGKVGICYRPSGICTPVLERIREMQGGAA